MKKKNYERGDTNKTERRKDNEEAEEISGVQSDHICVGVYSYNWIWTCVIYRPAILLDSWWNHSLIIEHINQDYKVLSFANYNMKWRTEVQMYD